MLCADMLDRFLIFFNHRLGFVKANDVDAVQQP